MPSACRLYPYKVALACLFLLLVGLSQPVLAQSDSQKGGVETIFSYGDVLLSDGPIPKHVMDTRRFVFQIYMVIHKTGDLNEIYAVSSGSAMAYPSKKGGVIVSSAHVIQQSIFNFSKLANNGEIQKIKAAAPIETNNIITIIGGDEEAFRKLTYAELKQKLADLNCSFTVYARAYSNIRFTELVPLKILAITEPENNVDVVVLQIDRLVDISLKAVEPPLAGEYLNPYKVLFEAVKLASNPAKAGDLAYLAGFGALQPFIEVVHVGARITSATFAPSMYKGLTNPYSVRGMPVPGFSGGPMFNGDGQLLAIIKGGDGKFTLAVSIDDINIVFKKAKLDK